MHSCEELLVTYFCVFNLVQDRTVFNIFCTNINVHGHAFRNALVDLVHWSPLNKWLKLLFVLATLYKDCQILMWTTVTHNQTLNCTHTHWPRQCIRRVRLPLPHWLSFICPWYIDKTTTSQPPVSGLVLTLKVPASYPLSVKIISGKERQNVAFV